jgi:Flp pilus assembly secretin CpaC
LFARCEPLASLVLCTSFAYYQVEVGNDNTDMLVMVTPYTGDPDLFVNLGKAQFPNTTSFDKSSNHFGAITDTVVFKAGQPPYCNNCLMNIAVWGFTNTYFSIQFSFVYVDA